MNIFKLEFKEKIKSSLIWSVSMFILIYAFMSFFQTFAGNAEGMTLMLENYPEELLKAFGMSSVDLSTIAGYFTMTMLFTQICLAIQASNYGFSILSIEERERTADFLLTKPIKRRKIFISKLLSAFIALTITNAVVWGSTLLFVEIFNEGQVYDINVFIKMLSTIVLFQLYFLGIGMVISVLVKKVRSVLSFSMALSFGMYMISALGSIIGEDVLAYITPYKYFEPSYLIINGKYDSKMIIVCSVIIIVSIIASYILYIKRNIHSAS